MIEIKLPMRPTILLATTNQKKQTEMQRLLEPLGFDLKTLADVKSDLEVIEDGETFAENATLKATQQAKHHAMWTIGEDSGLCVPALRGAPGIHSARYSGEQATDKSNNALLIERLEATGKPFPFSAYYASAIALADPNGDLRLSAYGECHGRIVSKHRGDGGFGYDPLFEVVEYHQTFAELGPAVKSAISHRGRSLRQFLRDLNTVDFQPKP